MRAGGSVSLPVLARRTAAAGLTGLEWAVGVPGSVGGGVRMNAGGHGSEISHTLRGARLFDLAGAVAGATDVTAADLDLGYRHSSVAPAQVVVSAEFGLAVGDRAAAEAELAAIVRWRRENQPGGANAGSVFTNPPGDSAGRLVDAAGCKGLRRGSAFVSPKHANFFQVDDQGRAADVVELMEEVRAAVQQAFGVLLEPEVRLVGFPNPRSRLESQYEHAGQTAHRPSNSPTSHRRPSPGRAAAPAPPGGPGVGQRTSRRRLGATRSPLLDVDGIAVVGADRTPRRGAGGGLGHPFRAGHGRRRRAGGGAGA